MGFQVFEITVLDCCEFRGFNNAAKVKDRGRVSPVVFDYMANLNEAERFASNLREIVSLEEVSKTRRPTDVLPLQNVFAVFLRDFSFLEVNGG